MPRESAHSDRLAGHSDRLGWLIAAGAATLASLAVVLFGLGRFLATFGLYGEDFALLLNSSARTMPDGGAWRWFAGGYSTYFLNYPDWGTSGSAFARPLANATFWLASLMSDQAGDIVFLWANYLSLVAGTFLFVYVIRRYTDASPTLAAVLGFVFGISPVWHAALIRPSMGTNTLALVFSVAALFVLHPERLATQRWRWPLAALMLTLAVCGHETALLAVPAVALTALAVRPAAPDWRSMLWLAVPVAVFVLLRALMPDAGDVYVSALTLAGFPARFKHALLGMLMPFWILGFLQARRELTLVQTLPYALAIVANLSLIGTMVWGVLRGRSRREWLLAAALALALVPGFIVDWSARFMGLAVVIALIGVVTFTGDTPRFRRVLVGLLVVAQVALFVGWAVALRGDDIEVSAGNARFFAYAREAIASTDARTVVLVDDNVGRGGSLAMLKLAAGGRTDLDLVVLNNYDGAQRDPSAVLRVQRVGGRVVVENRLGTRQTVVFDGATPDFSASSGGFKYRDVSGAQGARNGSFEASGAFAPGSVLVIGADPATGRPLEPRVY